MKNCFFYMSFNKFLLQITFFLVLLAFPHCEQKSTMESRLKGAWHAKWTMASNTDSLAQSMNGKFVFFPDGHIHIEAFGYKGCLFTCDTLSNDLQWKMQGDTLQIADKNEGSGLLYKIKYLSEDSMHLVLLDDIHISLKKI